MARQYSFEIPLKPKGGFVQGLSLTVWRDGAREPAMAMACLSHVKRKAVSSDLTAVETSVDVLAGEEWVIEAMPRVNNKRLMLLMELARQDVKGKDGPTWWFVMSVCKRHGWEVDS